MPATPPAADPHAGHVMPTPPPADPHAGHVMSGAAPPPDIPTSADNPGRPPEPPPPAAAFAGPDHAADLAFDSAAMAAARDLLRGEQGNFRTSSVMIDRLEAGFGDGEESFHWDAEAWWGGDINRLWLKSEGEGTFGGDVEAVELQALYSRAITPYFDVQAGLRHDIRPEPDRTHLVLGVQGVAPYWIEVEAAAFFSDEGELTAEAEAEYDLRLTQKLILQPRAEIRVSAEDIPELHIGSGVTEIETGLRLRYEIRPELAPYIGLEWSSALGEARDLARATGEDPDEFQLVVGLSGWF